MPILFQRLLRDSEAETGRFLLPQQDHAGGGKPAGRKTEDKIWRVFGQGGVEILQLSVRQKLETAFKKLKKQ